MDPDMSTAVFPKNEKLEGTAGFFKNYKMETQYDFYFIFYVYFLLLTQYDF